MLVCTIDEVWIGEFEIAQNFYGLSNEEKHYNNALRTSIFQDGWELRVCSQKQKAWIFVLAQEISTPVELESRRLK